MNSNISNINYFMYSSKQQFCIIVIIAISAYWKQYQNKSVSKETSIKLTESSLTYKDLAIISGFSSRE